MTALATALFYALLLTTAAGSIILAAGLLADRRTARWPAATRHRVLATAAFTPVGILVLSFAVRAAFPACGQPCADDPNRSRNSVIEASFMFGAAGKFPGLGGTAPPVQPAPLEQNAGPSWTAIAVLIWAAGAIVSLGRVVRRRAHARWVVAHSEEVTAPAVRGRLAALTGQAGLTGRVRVARHAEIAVPCVAGVLHSTLLLPQRFDPQPGEALDIVLTHELAHIERRDGFTTLAGEIAVALLWFHPLMRMATTRLGDLQEMAADQTVLASGVKPSAYAQFLLTMAREVEGMARPRSLGSLAILGHCQMTSRLRLILEAGPQLMPHAPARTWGLRLAFLLAGAMAAATPALTAYQSAPAFQRALLTQDGIDAIVRPAVINKMADRYVAGAAIAVVHEGKVVYQGGFGRREVFKEIPVDAGRTIWRIGSITKVLTGAAILQLVDRGALNLDADVNTYLTDPRVPATFPEPVRIRHLLTHTAGFDQIGLGRQVRSMAEVRPMGDFLRENLIRIRRPGEVSTYDTYAITLLGYLVEKISGLSYEAYLQQHLFQPLEMHRSFIAVPPALANDVAIGYGFAGTWEAERWEYMNTPPASSVSSTAPDMANFARMLLEGGRFNGRQILSERSAKAMLTQQFTNHPDHSGYSFTMFEDRSFGVPAFSHGGSMAGFGAFLYLVPQQRLGVFVASNQDSGVIGTAATAALIDALFPGHPPARARLPRLSGPMSLTRFVGRYANNMYHHTDPTRGWRINPIELKADADGRLVFAGAPAFPVGPLAFQRDDGVLLSFVEENGEIVRFVVNQMVYERLK